MYGIAGVLATLAIPFLITWSDPHIETSQSLCPFKVLTGLPCPGCGITKSIIFFYHGDIYKSFSYHIFGPFIIIFCVIAVFVLLLEIFTRKEYFNDILFSPKVAWAVAVTLAIYHLIRTIHLLTTHSFHEVLKESIWM